MDSAINYPFLLMTHSRRFEWEDKRTQTLEGLNLFSKLEALTRSHLPELPAPTPLVPGIQLNSIKASQNAPSPPREPIQKSSPPKDQALLNALLKLRARGGLRPSGILRKPSS